MISISFEAKVFTNFGQSVYLVGNHIDLGDWMPNLGFELTTSPERYPLWSSIKNLRLPEGYDLEFKIVIMNSCYQLSHWEGLFQNRQYTTSARCDEVTLSFQEGNPWMQEIFKNTNLNEKTVSIKDYARILTPLKIQQFPLLSGKHGQDDPDKQLLRESLYEFNSDIVQDANQNSNNQDSSSLDNLTSSSQPELSRHPSKFNDHYYCAEALSNKSVLLATTQKKMQRLKSEIKQLTKCLPVQGSNSIFLVYDDQRMDIMRAVIFGAEGTPYAHGAFIFDIFVPDEYPSVPPKIALISTKGGQIRFGPNLYESGSVCLSLLGTWKGDSAESWNATTSNLYQVLISIQSLVMNEDVFFNEPYYDAEKGTPYGEECNRAYCNIVRFWNLSHTINDAIEQPPVEFQKIILLHFYLQRESIRQMIESWIQDAEQPCQFDDLIFDHNAKIATKFQNDSLEYKRMLKEEQTRFEQLIENLEERVKGFINVQ